MNIESVVLIKGFIKSNLGGDIEKFVDLDLKNLVDDKVYGCPGRKFDADDCNLMRTIYCLVSGEAWQNLTMDNCVDDKQRDMKETKDVAI